MNLIIDIGNTLCKVAVAQNGELLDIFRFTKLTETDIEAICTKYSTIEKAILSSVRDADSILENYLEKKFSYYIKVSHETPLPIKNRYATPQTLGIDRLMSAVGAWSLAEGRELLIFDMGSAITIDNVSAKGEFIGGNISPGLNMRFKALHTFTQKLPLYSCEGDFSLIGKNTEEAIRGGVILGVKKEIEGYINEYSLKNSEIVIIFTGGDANYFVFKVKNTIFADRDLLLKGLNKVLEYNYDKN